LFVFQLTAVGSSSWDFEQKVKFPNKNDTTSYTISTTSTLYYLLYLRVKLFLIITPINRQHRKWL
jgi:hypothetical protein